MTLETIAALAISASVPISVALFRVLPFKADKPSVIDIERRHAPLTHDHNGKYVTRAEFQMSQQNTELLASNLKQTTALISDRISTDIAEIKERLNAWDEHFRIINFNKP